MEAVREATLIGLHDLRRALGSAKGIILLLLYMGTFLLSGIGFVLAEERLTKELEAQLGAAAGSTDAMQQLALRKFFETVAGDDAALAQSLHTTPLVVLFLFAIALVLLPSLTCLMGYDAIAGDLQHRTLRYTLLRARRGSYVVGKLLGQVLLLAALTLVTQLALFAFAALRVPNFEVAAGLAPLARFWLIGLLYGSSFCALALFCSSLTRAPLLALLGSFAALLVLGALLLVGMSEPLGIVSGLSPFSHWGALFAPGVRLGGGLAFYAAFIGLFSALTYVVVRARDV